MTNDFILRLINCNLYFFIANMYFSDLIIDRFMAASIVTNYPILDDNMPRYWGSLCSMNSIIFPGQ